MVGNFNSSRLLQVFKKTFLRAGRLVKSGAEKLSAGNLTKDIKEGANDL